MIKSISLIGMSNIGKSHWSQKLAAEGGYERVDCDALVEAHLEPELKKRGYKGLRDVALWMGQPFAPQYNETSRAYLNFEAAVIGTTLDRLRRNPEQPLVIDTTGSVIYLDPTLTAALRDLTQVVYLEASPDHAMKLFKIYMENPKPVIWGDAYRPMPGETTDAALRRCYPNLLSYRAARYATLAHRTLSFETHRVAKSAKELFEL